DLRQALAALTDPDDETARRNAELLQFRFDGSDPLAGHAVGNLLLVGLMELTRDPVAALDHARAMVGAVGRVLPMSRTPLGIEARVRGDDPTCPDELTTVRGQHAVAVSRGVVEDVRIMPPDASACEEAVDAVRSADWLLF